MPVEVSVAVSVLDLLEFLAGYEERSPLDALVRGRLSGIGCVETHLFFNSMELRAWRCVQIDAT